MSLKVDGDSFPVTELNKLDESQKRWFKRKCEERGLLCSVCQDPAYVPVMPNICDHLFCVDCLSEWSERKSTCPLCVQEINQKEFISCETTVKRITSVYNEVMNLKDSRPLLLENFYEQFQNLTQIIRRSNNVVVKIFDEIRKLKKDFLEKISHQKIETIHLNQRKYSRNFIFEPANKNLSERSLLLFYDSLQKAGYEDSNLNLQSRKFSIKLISTDIQSPGLDIEIDRFINEVASSDVFFNHDLSELTEFFKGLIEGLKKALPVSKDAPKSISAPISKKLFPLLPEPLTSYDYIDGKLSVPIIGKAEPVHKRSFYPELREALVERNKKERVTFDEILKKGNENNEILFSFSPNASDPEKLDRFQRYLFDKGYIINEFKKIGNKDYKFSLKSNITPINLHREQQIILDEVIKNFYDHLSKKLKSYISGETYVFALRYGKSVPPPVFNIFLKRLINFGFTVRDTECHGLIDYEVTNPVSYVKLTFDAFKLDSKSLEELYLFRDEVNNLRNKKLNSLIADVIRQFRYSSVSSELSIDTPFVICTKEKISGYVEHYFIKGFGDYYKNVRPFNSGRQYTLTFSEKIPIELTEEFTQKLRVLPSTLRQENKKLKDLFFSCIKNSINRPHASSELLTKDGIVFNSKQALSEPLFQDVSKKLDAIGLNIQVVDQFHGVYSLKPILYKWELQISKESIDFKKLENFSHAVKNKEYILSQKYSDKIKTIAKSLSPGESQGLRVDSEKYPAKRLIDFFERFYSDSSDYKISSPRCYMSQDTYPIDIIIKYKRRFKPSLRYHGSSFPWY